MPTGITITISANERCRVDAYVSHKKRLTINVSLFVINMYVVPRTLHFF